MLTKEEKKELRLEFWKKFKVYSNKRRLGLNNPGGWLMDNTGMKQLNLKFDFTENYAMVAIDVATKNLDKRIEIWEKLEGLKAIIEKSVPGPLTWEFDFPITGTKSVSRIYKRLDNVSVYEKTCWKQASNFLFDYMYPIETVFLEYRDFLKYND